MTLLIQIVHRIGKQAERRVEAAYLNDLKRVAGKTRILYRMADAALEHPMNPSRSRFSRGPRADLRNLVAEYKAQGGAYRAESAGGDAFLLSQPLSSNPASRSLEVLDFRSNNTAYQPVIQALARGAEYVSQRAGLLGIAQRAALRSNGVVPSSWEDIVTEQDSAGEVRVNRLTYELSVLQICASGYGPKRCGWQGRPTFAIPMMTCRAILNSIGAPIMPISTFRFRLTSLSRR